MSKDKTTFESTDSMETMARLGNALVPLSNEELQMMSNIPEDIRLQLTRWLLLAVHFPPKEGVTLGHQGFGDAVHIFLRICLSVDGQGGERVGNAIAKYAQASNPVQQVADLEKKGIMSKVKGLFQ